MEKGLIKNISMTFLANIISTLVSILSTLLIPKVMGVTEYGYWQLYIFYISYAGLLHLGLCDGVYLSNGGKNYGELCFKAIRTQFYILAGYVFALGIGVASFGRLFVNDVDVRKVILLTCIGAFIHVLRTYLQFILQTTNRLKEYSSVVIIDRIVFLIGIFSVTLWGKLSYSNVILCDITGRLVSLLVATLFSREVVFGKISFEKDVIAELIENIRSGSKLLIAGIASNFIIGFVRMGIQKQWDIEAFGKVSLSLSMINMVLSFISVVSIVFFPVLKRMGEKTRREVFQHMEVMLCFLTYFIMLFSGVGSKFIEVWLPQYSQSAFYLIILLPICVFESQTSMLLNTYIKAYRKEKKLMRINMFVTLCSAIFSMISTGVLKNLLVAVFGINILVLLRAFALKKVIYTELQLEKYRKTIANELILFAAYIIPYMLLDVMMAGGIYLMAYGIIIYENRDRIKKAVSYFQHKSNMQSSL